jgi:hypothetical protein
MGVRVVIMLPGELPDKIKIKYPEIPQPVAQPEIAKIEKPAAEIASTVTEKPSEPTKEVEEKPKLSEQVLPETPLESRKEPAEEKVVRKKAEVAKAKKAPGKEEKKTEAKPEKKAVAKKEKKAERKKGK